MSSWDEPWDAEPDPEDEQEAEVYPRDAAIDRAKIDLEAFFAAHPEDVFYERQLQVIFEDKYFHWITGKALKELSVGGAIASETEALPGVGTLRLFRAKSHRYWRRQAAEILQLVSRFSDPAFTRALGGHGEMMFDAALPRGGFLPKAVKVREYNGVKWTASAHDLDRVFERDGIAYGTEIKNTLSYIPLDEMVIKTKMCQQFRIRPLFIVRGAPKSYIEFVRQAGGFTLMFKYQLYPLGYGHLASEIKARLSLPVDCPLRIQDGTVQRFLKWHLRHLPNRPGQPR